MKKMIVFTGVLAAAVSGSIQARAGSLPQIPQKLACKAVGCLPVPDSSCDLKSYQHMELKRQGKGMDVSWKDGDGSSTDGVLFEQENQVIYDFGVRAHGGDQYYSFTFKREALEDLAAGRVNEVGGEYEDGYDWADGYHSRVSLLMSCTR